MEIKIRRIDRVVVQKLDDLARGRGLSREEYLRNLLTDFCALREFEPLENRYINLQSATLDQLRENTQVLEKLYQIFEIERGQDHE